METAPEGAVKPCAPKKADENANAEADGAGGTEALQDEDAPGIGRREKDVEGANGAEKGETINRLGGRVQKGVMRTASELQRGDRSVGMFSSMLPLVCLAIVGVIAFKLKGKTKKYARD